VQIKYFYLIVLGIVLSFNVLAAPRPSSNLLGRLKNPLPPLNGLVAIELKNGDEAITQLVYKELSLNNNGFTLGRLVDSAEKVGYRVFSQSYRMTSSQNIGAVQNQFSNLVYLLLFESRNGQEDIILILSFDENDNYLLTTVYTANRNNPTTSFVNNKTIADIISQFN
jgi:hypothetical protein